MELVLPKPSDWTRFSNYATIYPRPEFVFKPFRSKIRKAADEILVLFDYELKTW